jgi:hypothetical protein
MANLGLSFEEGGVVRISSSTAARGRPSARHVKVTDHAADDEPGISANTPEEQFRRTVLHEFGHALGLVHEHATPAGGIKWNREQVEREVKGAPLLVEEANPGEHLSRLLEEGDELHGLRSALDHAVSVPETLDEERRLVAAEPGALGSRQERHSDVVSA